MSTFTRRVVTFVIAAVAAVLATVVLSTPAQAWSGTYTSADDVAQIRLSDEEAAMVLRYATGASLGWSPEYERLCGELNTFVNGNREDNGLGLGIQQDECTSWLGTCVQVVSSRVQLTVYADNSHVCGSYEAWVPRLLP